MDAIPQLAGYRAKLERAGQHLESLRTSLEASLGNNEAYAIRRECHPDDGVYVFRLVVSNPFPMDEWGLLIGDCIHNARSALDHLFWQLLLLRHPGGDVERAFLAGFPIFRQPEVFQRKRSEIENFVGPAATRIIESLQPFNTSTPDDDVLYWLHKLDIADKHRVIIPSVGLIESGQLRIRNLNPLIESKFEKKDFFQNSLHNDVVLMTLVITPPNPDAEVQLEASRLSIFIDRGGEASYSVLKALPEFIKAVEDVAELFVPLFSAE